MMTKEKEMANMTDIVVLFEPAIAVIYPMENTPREMKIKSMIQMAKGMRVCKPITTRLDWMFVISLSDSI